MIQWSNMESMMLRINNFQFWHANEIVEKKNMADEIKQYETKWNEMKPNPAKPNQTKPKQSKPNATKPNQTKTKQNKTNETKSYHIIRFVWVKRVMAMILLMKLANFFLSLNLTEINWKFYCLWREMMIKTKTKPYQSNPFVHLAAILVDKVAVQIKNMQNKKLIRNLVLSWEYTENIQTCHIPPYLINNPYHIITHHDHYHIISYQHHYHTISDHHVSSPCHTVSYRINIIIILAYVVKFRFVVL